ncbi:MAG: hypothetical protein AAB927_01205 [Patescibacteria group bacterium]
MKDNEFVPPTIQLKLLKSQETYPPDEDPKTFFFECASCRKRTNKLGAMVDSHTKTPKYVCEPCAIDQFQKTYGFRSRKAAAARRRRIFDVPYLFQELYIGEYLKRKKVKFSELGEGAFEQIFILSREAYNGLFGPELKEHLEELEQWELEIIFRNFTERTPPFIMDGIDPHSVKSPFGAGLTARDDTAADA